jgi:hypothetical protein
MTERIFLIHGWSVSETTTYQALHLRLQAAGYDLHEIFLGRYVSLDDHVEVRDIAKAMHEELKRQLGPGGWKQPFHMITHSTGALVVKHWVHAHYRGRFLDKKPLRNLIFLAGPHFGSRLAHHGRSMLAHAAYFGDTGNQVLTALELGSEFSWDNNGAWLERETWKAKGIRPYALIGDRVEGGGLKAKVFPAGFEKGSDMVVRVPAGNPNFRRYELNGATGKTRKVGEVADVPFAALEAYVHSGARNGIMNSIKRASTPARHQALRLILRCLAVKSASDYAQARAVLDRAHAATRKKRSPYAQLDFRFRDETGGPIDDYSFVLGVFVNGRERASKSIANTHKNTRAPNHFTAFVKYDEINPKRTYFIDLSARSSTELFDYKPDHYRLKLSGAELKGFISPDQTTQLDVIMARDPRRNLFVFHRADSSGLHLRWNRGGEISDTDLPIE